MHAIKKNCVCTLPLLVTILHWAIFVYKIPFLALTRQFLCLCFTSTYILNKFITLGVDKDYLGWKPPNN